MNTLNSLTDLIFVQALTACRLTLVDYLFALVFCFFETFSKDMQFECSEQICICFVPSDHREVETLELHVVKSNRVHLIRSDPQSKHTAEVTDLCNDLFYLYDYARLICGQKGVTQSFKEVSS